MGQTRMPKTQYSVSACVKHTTRWFLTSDHYNRNFILPLSQFVSPLQSLDSPSGRVIAKCCHFSNSTSCHKRLCCQKEIVFTLDMSDSLWPSSYDYSL